MIMISNSSPIRVSRIRHGIRGAIVLLSWVAVCLAPLFPANAAQTPNAQAAPAPARIEDPFPEVVKKALRRAGRSYKADEYLVPDFLRDLNESQWQSIRFKPEQALWQQQNSPFTLELYHPGFIYTRSVAINLVTPSGIAPLNFSPEMFTYGNKALAEKVKQAPPGFAGFRVTPAAQASLPQDPLVSFLGASYFRSSGKHARPGLSARALALNTALPGGEEFPYFREFWIVAPAPEDTSLTVCALMDSPSMTGAFRYAITPGTSSVMDVEARIFLRKNSAWPQKIGIAALTSMFLYSETGSIPPGEYRPEVHSSDGLLFRTGENAWSWSPLANPARLAVNTFPLEDIRGFGLMQRDDNFDHYQDIEARFDRRPSAWVEPRSDWGPGRIELVEIPSTEEI
ncbi:MAG: glucan biosynthesis protein, partial [Deltaproteobacteria bacterium]|nr:glucan biosynthesis protein [Deltaproteobacteria bacterium]